MNEETIKNKIILPYFQSLGFDITQMEFETSFTIRLGTFTHTIDGVKDQANGRLDILFKKNGENLFVVETKAENHKLTNDDKLQAISYARLLQNIAPFAVVSNGIETKIYDVITGDELPNNDIEGSTYVRNGYKIALDPNLKYNALKSFIGLNFENLKVFCRKQQMANMQNLIATEHNLDTKFNPEIYLPRNNMNSSFINFLTSEKKIFSIVAESGFGKTNAICDLAIQYTQTNPTLFFNASQITDDLPQEIACEFNWEFDGDRSGVSVIKKIAEILIQYNTDLIIFIDAVDEFPNKDSKLLLERFIKNCPSRIKFCLTCKESLWPGFIAFQGIQSFIYTSLFLQSQNSYSSFVIPPFSDTELDEVISKYRNFFKLPDIKGYTKELCRHPLMLRSLSEVYRSQANMPDDLIPLSVTRIFLDKKLEKSMSPDKDLKCLSAIGRILFDQDKEITYEDELPNAISDFLVSFNLLRRTKDEMGRYIIGFQYDHIRNYILSFHSLKLDTLTDSEIIALVKNNIEKAVARNLFFYYYKLSNEKIKGLLKKEFSAYNLNRATLFIDSYQEIIDTEYKQIRNRFLPYTNGNIGLLVFYGLDMIVRPEYGFRIIREGEPRVIWLERESWSSKDLEKEKMHIAQNYSVRSTYMSSHDFTVIAPSQHAKKRIIGQLKKLVEYRELDESNNINLMIEHIIEKSKEYREFFKLASSSKVIFPIDTKGLFKKVSDHLSYLKNICESQGEANYSYELPTDLLKLYNYLKIINDKAIVIENNLLPLPSKGTIPIIGREIGKYTDEELMQYLTVLFSLVLKEYQILVETNFSEKKALMKTYKLLPARVIGEIEKKGDGESEFTHCIVKGSNETKIEIVLNKGRSIFDDHSMSVKTVEGTIRLERCCICGIYLFFEPDYSRFSGRLNNIIQKRVYDLVFDDFKEIYHW